MPRIIKTEKRAKRRYSGPLARTSSVQGSQMMIVPRAYKRQRSGNEVKNFDTDLSFTVDNTGEVPATGQLVLIPQGDTATTRDGRQCTVKSVQIRANATFAPGAGAVGSTNAVIYLVLDKQCNGAAAAVTDVFNTASLWKSVMNLANSDRFVIMKKWVINFTTQAGVTTAFCPISKQIEYYKRCNIPLQFSSTTGAITELRSNNLFLIAGSEGTDDLITVDGICRVRFQG